MQRKSTPGSRVAQQQAILQLQRRHGNQFVQRKLTAGTVQRCGAGGCTCGGKCGSGKSEDEDRNQTAATTPVVQRSMMDWLKKGANTVGSAISSAAETTGNAIESGAEWVGDQVSTGANWVKDKAENTGEFFGDVFGGAEREGCQQDPSWQYEYDGCSVPPIVTTVIGAADKDNPAGGSDTQFANQDRTGPCDNHDRCYQTCASEGDGRSNCDDQMYQDMLAVCENSSEDEETVESCFNYANIYYRGLQVGGGGAYNERQEAVCQCSP